MRFDYIKQLPRAYIVLTCFLLLSIPYAELSSQQTSLDHVIISNSEPTRYEFDEAIGRGWHEPETADNVTFRWMSRERATLPVEIPAGVAYTVQIRVLLSPLPAVLDSLTLSIDGEPLVLTRETDDDGGTIFTGTLSPLSEPADDVDLVFEVDEVVVGADIWGTDDERELGVALDWITFTPAVAAATRIEFDEVIDGEGWRGDVLEDGDTTFQWTSAVVSELEVPLTADSTIRIRVLGALDPTIVESLRLSVDGTDIALSRTADEEPSPLGTPAYILEGVLPVSLADEDTGTVTLTFEIDRVINAQFVGASGEPFGVAFDWIVIDSADASTSVVQACPTFVYNALEVAREMCASLGRDQACYGNLTIEAEPASFQFSTPGDIADLEDMRQLRLSAINEETEEWGIAVLEVQASRQEERPENVTLLLFGDVQVENNAPDFSDGVSALVNVGIDVLNIRSAAGLDADIVARVRDGSSLRILDGPRYADGYSWWQVVSEDGVRGWATNRIPDTAEETLIFPTLGRLIPGGRAMVYTTERDVLNLRDGPGLDYARIARLEDEARVTVLEGPVESDGFRWWNISTRDGVQGWAADFVDGLPTLITIVEGPRFGPIEAFTFESGSDDSICDEAPESGLLIQTPEGLGEVSFLVNEVSVQLGSTAYLQTDNSSLTIAVLEGRARVQAGGVGQVVNAGAQTEIPLGASQQLAGPPQVPQPYNLDDLKGLPLDLLPRPITAAPPLASNLAGLATGDVQVTLIWDNDADMDVSVSEPNGSRIWYGNRSSSTGGQLDIDSNFPCGSNLGSVENIYWPVNQSPRGNFQVTVNEFSECGDGDANWQLIVRVEGQVVLDERGVGGSASYTFSR